MSKLSFNDLLIVSRYLTFEYDLINLLQVNKKCGDLNNLYYLQFEPTILKNKGVEFPHLNFEKQTKFRGGYKIRNGQAYKDFLLKCQVIDNNIYNVLNLSHIIHCDYYHDLYIILNELDFKNIQLILNFVVKYNDLKEALHNVYLIGSGKVCKIIFEKYHYIDKNDFKYYILGQNIEIKDLLKCNHILKNTVPDKYIKLYKENNDDNIDEFKELNEEYEILSIEDEIINECPKVKKWFKRYIQNDKINILVY